MGVVEVCAGSHPAMDLVLEDLDVLGYLEVVFELLDLLFRLLSRGEQHSRNRETLGIGGIDHGRVDLGSDREGVGVSLDTKGNDLAAPAVLFKPMSVVVSYLQAGLLTPTMPSFSMEESCSLTALT